jgi:integrase
MSSVRLFAPDSPGEGITVKEVTTKYLAIAKGSPAALADKASILGRFSGAFGDADPLTLCPDDLEVWVLSQTTLTSDWTRRRWVAAVNAALNWAVRKKRLIPYNPVAGVRFRCGKRGRPLTDREFRAMLRHATDQRFRRLLLFLRYTGCRPNEAASATWNDVDLDRRAIVLDKHKTEHVTHEPRVIYLPPQGVRLLSLIALTDKHEGRIFVNAWGNPWGRSALSQRVQTIRRRSGIPRDAKLYGCRHAHATNAILSGVDIATLAQLMGHTGTRTTQTYLHLAGKDAHLRAAVDKIKR